MNQQRKGKFWIFNSVTNTILEMPDARKRKLEPNEDTPSNANAKRSPILEFPIGTSASGRYILSSESISFLKLGEILKDSFGNTYPFPKRKAPKFLFWILAPFFGVKRNFVSNNVGYGVFFNNEKSNTLMPITVFARD